jgi:F-type H+-transporting ATPase subunit epsilon
MATEIRSDKIQLEIVTPRGRALDVSADEVTAPSVSGEFGVMPGHLPLLAALRTGIVTYRQGTETKKCAVGAGFAEAGPNKVSILTDEYIEREQIDPVIVRKELAEVQAEIAKADQKPIDTTDEEADEALALLVLKENWLAAQLELYGDPPPATMRPFETFGPPEGPVDGDVPMPENGGGAESTGEKG